MQLAYSFSLIILFSVLFLLEGVGSVFVKIVTPAFVSLLILVFFLNIRKNIYPQKITLLFVGFLVFSLISLATSPNIFLSFNAFLFYLSSFIVFILALYHEKLISRMIVPFIFAFSILFIIYSMILGGGLLADSLIPQNGYQFVYPRYSSHNSLGEFLMLPLIYFIYCFLFKKINIINAFTFLFLSIFFIFAFSRSAYIDLFVVTSIIFIYAAFKKKINYLKSFFFVVLVFFLILIFFTRSKYSFKIEKLANLKNEFQSGEILSVRDKYLTQAYYAFLEKPIFGVGPGSFIYSSKDYSAAKKEVSESSHNIFIDVLVENGIIAAGIFISIIFLLVKNSEKNVFFFMWLALLLNFQTYYSHRIFSFFLLFCILAGLSYSRRGEKTTVRTGNIKSK